MYLLWRSSRIPSKPPSRPNPDCLFLPKMAGSKDNEYGFLADLPGFDNSYPNEPKVLNFLSELKVLPNATTIDNVPVYDPFT